MEREAEKKGESEGREEDAMIGKPAPQTAADTMEVSR